jgi:hypothetical protein
VRQEGQNEEGLGQEGVMGGEKVLKGGGRCCSLLTYACTSTEAL